MYKKKKDRGYSECPICGGKIWGSGQKVLIEGAKLRVCDSCAQFGKKIISKKKTSQIKSTLSKKQYKPRAPRNMIDSKFEIVSDFAKRVRKARTSRNLNQEKFAKKLNEKPSLIRRIESGKVKPTEQLARKFEHVYEIKLLKEKSEIAVDTNKYMKKRASTSLGDIAFIKKKKK
ncbi:MAG: TIGR00270 family protein [Candidatus Lokiarchaeota archaeon]|nr:TIGR00270 family protein [Candidatus Lokiarchaeota archaeon]MBD3342264.1 TIGR00270 family protein [Candidatus Lokiarchaeota archaeon]